MRQRAAQRRAAHGLVVFINKVNAKSGFHRGEEPLRGNARQPHLGPRFPC